MTSAEPGHQVRLRRIEGGRQPVPGVRRVFLDVVVCDPSDDRGHVGNGTHHDLVSLTADATGDPDGLTAGVRGREPSVGTTDQTCLLR